MVLGQAKGLAEDFFLFTSFRGNGEDGLHLTISTNGYNHRVYCSTTADFQRFTESRLLFDPGFNVIDATLLEAGSGFYLFLKDERKQPLKKNLRFATADRPEGPYGQPSEPFTGDWVEGPTAIKIRNEYVVYFDHYAQPEYYGAVRSQDLRRWEDCSKGLAMACCRPFANASSNPWTYGFDSR
jgi:hypothetical protein